MDVDTKFLRSIAGDVCDEISFSSGNAVYAAAYELDALRAAQHDMAKCPNCEKCIADLRAEVGRLKDAEHTVADAALVHAALLEIGYSGCGDPLEMTGADFMRKVRAVLQHVAKESPCKP